MSSMRKWSRSIENLLGETLNVVLFTSRNKDNRHVENLKERRESFVTTLSAESESLKDRFDRFVQGGVDGEMSRMYISINPRSNEKTKKDLMIKMLSDNFSLARVPEMTARLASKKENIFDPQNVKWMFDVDPHASLDLAYVVETIMLDIAFEYYDPKKPKINIETHRTPNGYAIIVDQHFDTRPILSKWKNVELKRDAMLCAAWDTCRKETK